MVLTLRAEKKTEQATNAWQDRAPELAAWAWDRYVIRDDVWGGYNSKADRGKECQRRDGTKYKLGSTCTRPNPSKRGTVKLTLDVLQRHFRARSEKDIAGIHTTSLSNYSKFGTVEIDVHGEGGNSPEATANAAVGWYERLVEAGFHPLLWDSNGAGGYHLDVLFTEPMPTARLFWFLRELVTDHARYGLSAPPETFPKQPGLRPQADGRGSFGNWVRLIGRHHSRDHWARVFDGETWHSDGDAVDYALELRGDSTSLVPADAEVNGRLNAYIRTLPNLGDGQGRDDVAYQLMAFAARDLQLPDDEVLRRAEDWDQSNRPPKGRERLVEILANVHQYGQRQYGVGLDNNSTTPPVDQSPAPAPVPLMDGLGIILADYRERLRPKFRRGQAVFSEAYGRDVKPAEGCFAPDRKLVKALATAHDAPRDSNAVVDPKRLPKFYREWARSAWAEMLNDLAEEADASEVVTSAEAEFKRAVSAGLHEQVTLGQDGKEPERRSYIDWAYMFAKPGSWNGVRSHPIWCRRDSESAPVAIAVRVELFRGVRLAGLSEMGYRKFAALAALYGIGKAGECRAGGNRCVELTPEFLSEVRESPNCPVGEG